MGYHSVRPQAGGRCPFSAGPVLRCAWNAVKRAIKTRLGRGHSRGGWIFPFTVVGEGARLSAPARSGSRFLDRDERRQLTRCTGSAAFRFASRGRDHSHNAHGGGLLIPPDFLPRVGVQAFNAPGHRLQNSSRARSRLTKCRALFARGLEGRAEKKRGPRIWARKNRGILADYPG